MDGHCVFDCRLLAVALATSGQSSPSTRIFRRTLGNARPFVLVFAVAGRQVYFRRGLFLPEWSCFVLTSIFLASFLPNIDWCLQQFVRWQTGSPDIDSFTQGRLLLAALASNASGGFEASELLEEELM